MTQEERDEIKQIVIEVIRDEIGVLVDDNVSFPMKDSATSDDAVILMNLDSHNHATAFSRVKYGTSPSPTPTSSTFDTTFDTTFK